MNGFCSWSDTELTLQNGLVRRVISLPKGQGSVGTRLYQPIHGNNDYFEHSSPEFQFVADGVTYSGESRWTVQRVEAIEDALAGAGAAVTLRDELAALEVTLRYLLYPELPIIRKNIVLRNLMERAVVLESVDVEKFQVKAYAATVFSWIYSDYGRRKSIGAYDGNGQDSLIIVHNMDTDSGIFIGNEASGVLKHTAVLWGEPAICSGLTHADARYPFRKYLAPGEAFQTPQVFTMVYNGEKTPERLMNTALPDFVQKHMGIRLSKLKRKPTFVYNTWNPFLTDINEQLIMTLAKACAEAGIKEFVIDDGWEDNLGDWGVDAKKFPHGLKPVFDYIKSLGMKPGLWVSVGSACPESKVYKEHPEWFVKGSQGEFANLQLDDDEAQTVRSACFSTGWRAYIKGVLNRLIEEHGLEYLKLDFAVVSSPYRLNPMKAGCFAEGHEHKDRNESMYMNFQNMWHLFDELHEENPELFIDCTFEAMGGLQLIDYALLQHAEGDWLSNFEGAMGEKTDLRLRNMAWWRSPAMPATALVIGNAQMQDSGWELHLKSAAGALPMMLGDPRMLSAEERSRCRFDADWLARMEESYGVMGFRQDLYGFGEPMEGSWDGFQRINTDTREGGLIGVFRQGAIEAGRTVTVQYLDPTQTYQIKTMTGEVIVMQTGKELASQGFRVELPTRYAGVLYEVAKAGHAIPGVADVPSEGDRQAHEPQG